MPPSAKALNWFCCQPESSAVYPLFFISKDTTDNPSYKSLYVNETRGVFGIGAAIYFTPSSSSTKRFTLGELIYNACCNYNVLQHMHFDFDIFFYSKVSQCEW